jgi:hypothetical protein
MGGRNRLAVQADHNSRLTQLGAAATDRSGGLHAACSKAPTRHALPRGRARQLSDEASGGWGL